MLLLAVRSPPQPVDAESIRRTNQEAIDWELFLATARAHRLGPLAWKGLQKVPGLAIPGFVLESLRAGRSLNRLHSIKAVLEAQHIAEHFAAYGFPLVLLKGTDLARTLYEDPFDRHCGDLDLLTELRELPRQIALLHELGYTPAEPAAVSTPHRLRCHIRFWKDLTFVHRRSGSMLDLHWRLFNNRMHPANGLAEAKQRSRAPFSTNARALTGLERTDQFLYCAAHGASDAWIYLKSLADVAAFLRLFSQEELTAALQRAATLHLLRQVSSAIRLAAEWMGATAGHPLEAGPGDPFHLALRARVLAELERTAFCPERHNPGALAAVRHELGIVPGVRSALQIGGRYLWRPRVWSVVDLPDPLLWLTPAVGLLLPPRFQKTVRKPQSRLTP